MFKLLRYFSVTSAIAIVVMTILLSTVYWKSATTHLIKHIENQSVALAQSFANVLWPQYKDYVNSASGLDGDALRARPETHQIHTSLKALISNLPVLKVKIYNLNGLTVYSSEFSQMGVNKESNTRFGETVQRGIPITKNSFRKAFLSFDGLVKNRHLVESYLPINGPNGRVEGVIELYTDVTPLIADINKTTTNVVLYLLFSLGLLYWALYLIVRRADHIMGRQLADLKQANKSAITASKAKSDFLANMSHELRTPLNSIMILSKMLSNNKDNNLTPRQSESATVIHNSGRNLLTLIDTILDLSKVEAGKIELTIADLEIKEEVYHLLRQFEPMAQEKGLTLAINIDKKVANTFRTDSQRFLQILKNLFSNAIKFTSSGSVTLNIEHPDKVVLQGLKLPYEQIITFSVVDTGIGIPEEKRKSVFDAFKQADGSINRQYGGTGLGLKISRELATLLGGELHLSKSSNAGSTFTLYLPVDKGLTQEPIEAGYKFNETAIDQSKSNPPQITDPDNRYQNIPNYQDEIEPGDRTILIIEDDGNFAKILQNLAHEEGYKTIVTNMGFSGLILARSLKPSAIYLDLGLPDIDGLSVLNQLKSDPQTNHIPIQVVSGREDDDQAIDRGAVGFLRKPVSNENLGKMFACFDNHFKGITNDEEMLGADEYNQTNVKNSAPQSPKTTLERHNDKKIFENKKVLLVDDNMANVSALSLILKDAGLEVETADNGQLALDKLAKVNDINIVLMDIMMPVMDGLEAIRKIRIQPEFLTLPVIALTAKAMRRDCEDCINAGANDYLSKPIDTDKLLYLMRMRLSPRPTI